MPNGKIPVSVIIVTKNEEKKLAACLEALSTFDEVLVIDSSSRDRTEEVARHFDFVTFVPFSWNGQYPKKRQWCLNHLSLRHDWVFFVDADEIVPAELSAEIADLFAQGCPERMGYFVTGRYRIGGEVLKHGIPNRKIALLDRRQMEFPVVDDLDIPGMGEIEGHYQPVAKGKPANIGRLVYPLYHDALDDERAWAFRHEKYAMWEAGMNRKGAWPCDPVPWRERAKKLIRTSRFRPEIMFLVCFFIFLGFLDGKNGKKLALGKYKYYKHINKITENKNDAGGRDGT